jgi:hypothetical protein
MAEKDLSAVLLSSKGGYCIASFNLVSCDRFQSARFTVGEGRSAAYFFGAVRFLAIFVLVIIAIIIWFS